MKTARAEGCFLKFLALCSYWYAVTSTSIQARGRPRSSRPGAESYGATGTRTGMTHHAPFGQKNLGIPAVQEGCILGRDVSPEHRVEVHRRRVLAGRDLAAERLGHGSHMVRARAAADTHVVHAQVAGLGGELRHVEARAGEGIERDREGPLAVGERRVSMVGAIASVRYGTG